MAAAAIIPSSRLNVGQSSCHVEGLGGRGSLLPQSGESCDERTLEVPGRVQPHCFTTRLMLAWIEPLTAVF